MLVSCIGLAIGQLFWRTFHHRYFADDEFRHVSFHLANYGFLISIALRGVPILAEMSVLAAGFHRYSIGRFMIAMAVSNSFLAAIRSYLGISAANTESDYFFALAFLLIPLTGYSFRLYWKQSKVVGSKT